MNDLSPEILKARLDSETRSRSAPNMRPVDAATLVLVDRRPGTPRC